MIAIKLKLSEQVIEDAIRYKREEFKKTDRAWGHQLEWDRFWNAAGFKIKDKRHEEWMKKMSVKRSSCILQEQKPKNVTPKFENTITHTYGAIEGDYDEL